MKIKNLNTNVVFNLPKQEVDFLLKENPDVYELMASKSKKQKKSTGPQTQKVEERPKTLLPLIWDC